MSTKPVALTPWATAANYPADAAPEAGTPTKVAFSLGQATIGDRPNSNPIAMQDNDWRYRVGLWNQYLSDGVLDAISVITSFAVTGPTTLTGAVDIDGEVSLHASHAVTVAGRNNRGLLMDAAATTFLSKTVPLDDQSIPNSFGGGGTMTTTTVASGETIRTVSDAGAHFQANVPLEPGDEIRAVSIIFDGPTPLGSWPDVLVRHYDGGQTVEDSMTTTTDATATNQYRIGSGSPGAGRTVQRYTVDDPVGIPNGLVNNTTVWQLGGTAAIHVTTNQNSTIVFRISVEYRRKAVPTFAV